MGKQTSMQERGSQESTGAARADALLLAHAGYLVLTGVWPIVHRGSFERVSGRKGEFWLVRTVGGLAAAIGTSLGAALVSRQRKGGARTLALGSAVVFAVADVHAARAVSRTYLLDLLAQVVFAWAWLRNHSSAEPSGT
jgi:hypothetical protein